MQVADEQPFRGVHVRVLVLRVAHVPGAEGVDGRRGRLLALRLNLPRRLRLHPRPRPGDQKQVGAGFFDLTDLLLRDHSCTTSALSGEGGDPVADALGRLCHFKLLIRAKMRTMKRGILNVHLRNLKAQLCYVSLHFSA